MTLPRYGTFDPSSRKGEREGRADPALFRCPCGGTMFDVTPKLAEAMGVLHYECDTCHKRAAHKPTRRPL